MNYFRLKPERPSNIWQYSTVDDRGEIQKMVFAYDFWSNEPIFRDIRYFFVRRSVATALQEAGLTGFQCVEVPTIKSKQYDSSDHRDRDPEPVGWLQVTGRMAMDDFGLQGKAKLVVSERALGVLRNHGLVRCEVIEYDPNEVPPSTEDFWRRIETKN